VTDAAELDAVLAAFRAFPFATRESDDDGAAPEGAPEQCTRLLHAPLFAHQLFGHEEAVVGHSGVRCLVCFALPSLRCLVVTETEGESLDATMCDDVLRRLSPALHRGAATTDPAVMRAFLSGPASGALPAPRHPDELLAELRAEAKARWNADQPMDDDDDEDDDDDDSYEPVLRLPTTEPWAPASSADRPDTLGTALARFRAADGVAVEVRAWGADGAAAAEVQRRVEALCMWLIETADGVALGAMPWSVLAAFRADGGAMCGYASLTRFLSPAGGPGGGVESTLRLGQLLTVPRFGRLGVASGLLAALHGAASAVPSVVSVTVEDASDGLAAVRDRVEVQLALRSSALATAAPLATAAASGASSGAWAAVAEAFASAAAAAGGGAAGRLGPALLPFDASVGGMAVPAPSAADASVLASGLRRRRDARDAARAAERAERLAELDGGAVRAAVEAGRPVSSAARAVCRSCRVARFMGWRAAETILLLEGELMGDGEGAAAWRAGLERSIKRRCLAQLKDETIEDPLARAAFAEHRFREGVARAMAALAGLGLVGAERRAEAEAAAEEAEAALDAEADRAKEREQASRTQELMQKVLRGEVDTEGDPELEAIVQLVRKAAQP